jgi:hypothetical protein
LGNTIKASHKKAKEKKNDLKSTDLQNKSKGKFVHANQVFVLMRLLRIENKGNNYVLLFLGSSSRLGGDLGSGTLRISGSHGRKIIYIKRNRAISRII